MSGALAIRPQSAKMISSPRFERSKLQARFVAVERVMTLEP
jgi:hypothetical protein